MLENNAKNKNAAHIFVNPNNDLAPEYAEVDNSAIVTSLSKGQDQGPYATTSLVDSPFLSSSSNSVSVLYLTQWSDQEIRAYEPF